MKVRCIDNQIVHLDKKLQQFAFAQDDQGVVDLSVGQEYDVYGVRENKNGIFYLILTDTIHDKLPWWMPARFFEVADNRRPNSWESKSWGRISKDTITTHPAYFDAIDDVEDGTPKGYKVFKQMQETV
jgi:hypothetical protein